MDRANHEDIRIGTIVQAADCPQRLKQIQPLGFECFQITFGGSLAVHDLSRLADECKAYSISCIGLYANPLQSGDSVEEWKTLILSARLFGCDVVSGFAGALEDRPVDESLPRFGEVFRELARIAEGEGVRIAFENCDMGGTWHRPKWNIAHSPRAWEMMFNEVPSPALGLEWEPCHQMVSFANPMPQLREWHSRIFHIHGKDASVQHDLISKFGIRSGLNVVWHRHPGFGDTNWTDIISILRSVRWRGAIDIEGWHDPVYRDDLEMTGQVHALEYLRACRGGRYVPNPY
ncbi:MAG: sugar phosphate isomerase [Armatimonadota bacterium]